MENKFGSTSTNVATVLGKPPIEQNWRRGDVLVEDNVWIGAGVVVLPGAIIAAGAVVRGEVPSNTIYGGNPSTTNWYAHLTGSMADLYRRQALDLYCLIQKTASPSIR